MAPEAYISAGTATNVYAVYRSPPTRNQVIQPPNLRPPNPHSSRWSMVSPDFQRAAMKPITATPAKSTRKTSISVTLMSVIVPPPHPRRTA